MSIDLLTIIPEKFHSSEFVQQFLEVMEGEFEDYNELVAALVGLVDPYEVPDDYLQLLADLLNFTLSDPDDVSVDRRRNELTEAVDWFKMKGTYQAINLIALWAQFNFTIYDKYTNDYVTFVDIEWFVGDEGENPPSLDSTYYKSPHFGISIDLDHVYPAGEYTEGVLDGHLWRPSLFVGVTEHVEKTRPANTVPHYSILLSCATNESGEPFELGDTQVVTAVLTNWEFTKNYFNDGKLFNDGEFFNESLESFISTITKWQLGTGSVSNSINLYEDVPTTLDSVLLEGTVDGYTFYEDRVEIWFVVAASVVQHNINQMGLFSTDPTEEMVVCSTFPDIHKGSVTELKVVVTIYRNRDPYSITGYGEGYYGGGAYGI